VPVRFVLSARLQINVLINTVRNSIPDIVAEELPPYDYIVLCTKSVPDVGPTSIDLVKPALPKDNTHTTLVLLQNGLNIEKTFLATHPDTVVLSGVSLIGSAEPSPGHIVQNEPDRLLIGAFPHPSIASEIASAKAQEFVTLYSAGGKTDCKYSPNVLHDRWRKLVYNACLNPICAITGVDSGRIRLADGALDGLVRPAMEEIVAAAKVVANVELEDDVVEKVINTDPLESWAKPSMQQDLEKVRPIRPGTLKTGS
jgi:2-dehydropantoate 2-reductase